MTNKKKTKEEVVKEELNAVISTVFDAGEEEICTLLINGYSKLEIAKEMGITPAEVRKRFREIKKIFNRIS